MKVRYVGESFYGEDGLTNGRVYECRGLEDGGDFGRMLRVIDNSGDDYLYSAYHPGPPDMSSPGGRWEIVQDDAAGTLAATIQ